MKNNTTASSDPRYQVKNPEAEAALKDIGRIIKDQMPDNMGFALLMFDYGKDGAMFYLSSAQREDMVKAMLEFLQKQGVELYSKLDIERMMTIPCCHTTGMHDPKHYRERKYICDSQKREVFDRMCKELGINPRTKSNEDCGWCHGKDEWCPKNRKGEGFSQLDDITQCEMRKKK